MTLATVLDVARIFKRDCSDPKTQAFVMALRDIAHTGQDEETVESLDDLAVTARRNLEAHKHGRS